MHQISFWMLNHHDIFWISWDISRRTSPSTKIPTKRRLCWSNSWNFVKIHAWQNDVLKRQIRPYLMKYFCQRWQYFREGKRRAIFYARYLIEFTMYCGDLTFKIILDASSLEILQFCNVKKWFWMILHTFIYTSVRIDFKAKSKCKCCRINFIIHKMSQISQLSKKKSWSVPN